MLHTFQAMSQITDRILQILSRLPKSATACATLALCAITPTLASNTPKVKDVKVPHPYHCPTSWATPYNDKKLDIGIYWYSKPLGKFGHARRGLGCRARRDGKAIAGYYDPSKPTLIFVHGWQMGYINWGNTLQGNINRSSFWSDPMQRNVAKPWLTDGWNVGIFQWTQLADDETTLFVPYNSQAKIWTTNYSMQLSPNKIDNIGMRYKVPWGYSKKNAPKSNVSQLFYQLYKQALSRLSYRGPKPVRLLGHSLGVQLSLGMAELAYQDDKLPAHHRPARIVISDPFWTPNAPLSGHHYNYLAPDSSPAQRSNRIVKQLIAKGVVFEWLKSSDVLQWAGDTNPALLKVISRAQLYPEFLGLNLSGRHMHAWQWYMLQKGRQTGFIGPDNSLQQARQLMLAKRDEPQKTGQDTSDPQDDSF